MSEKRPMPAYQDVDGFRFPQLFLPDAVRSAINFKPRPGDFFVVTFPKCGTTWTQQIVNLIFYRGVSASTTMEFFQRSPYLELTGADILEQVEGPGPLKLHLPYHLTPISPQAKYLYVVRNPKDTLVSFYHHTNSVFYDYLDGDFNDFFELFLDGKTDFEDYFDHVLGWYEHRNDPNVMFLTYEEMKQDKPKAVMKIARFMGDEYAKMLEDEPEIFNNVLRFSTLEHMKYLNDSPEAMFDGSKMDVDKLPSGMKHIVKVIADRKQKNGKVFEFARKGIVGGWRENLSEDQNRRMDEKIEKRLKGTDLYTYWKKINCI